MAFKVLSAAAALGLLIGSSAAFAQATPDQTTGQKLPEKALMDPKAGVTSDTPARLTQETGVGGAAFAAVQGTPEPTGAGNH